MDDKLSALSSYRQTIQSAPDLSALENLRVTLLGKKGLLTEQLKELGQLPPEERKAKGQLLNQVKEDLAQHLQDRKEILEAQDLEQKLRDEKIDVTLPPRPQTEGKLHPITQTIAELVAIFADMGFHVAEGPDIEDQYYNFGALNFPDDHPAKEAHDTFYIDRQDAQNQPFLLRTHTSPVQIRAMKTQKPPIRIIAPGRCYRSDYDATHTPMFHQIEGLVIDRDINMGHLKGCLETFCKAFFEIDKLELRFRASFFPFTEPSAEVDMRCSWEKGKLILGEGNDWLEILGSGMVHPNVLKECGIDPDEYQGFAFGMGIERIAMLKYGIPDLRTFFASHVGWLHHYGFSPLQQPNLAEGLTS